MVTRRPIFAGFMLSIALAVGCLAQTAAPTPTPTSTQTQPESTSRTHPAAVSYPRVLRAADVQAVLPATVFFKGQSAAVQARNSGGIEFAKGSFLLATLVDTSGYSTSVQERYQAYLITEASITIDGHRLPSGAYGCGFIAGDRFVVMDLGGHDLFVAASTRDPALKRPTPLQVMAAPGLSGGYRLYAGRTYVEFRSAPEAQP